MIVLLKNEKHFKIEDFFVEDPLILPSFLEDVVLGIALLPVQNPKNLHRLAQRKRLLRRKIDLQRT